MISRKAALEEAGRQPHRIIPYAVKEPERWELATGRCALCDRPIREVADYRGGRWRHVETASGGAGDGLGS